MKLGLMADVHGNLGGLMHALALLDDADELLLAGDALNSYRMQAELLALLQEREIRYILGNNERSLLRHSPPQSRSGDDRSAWELLERTPSRLELNVGDRRLLMVHGSPWPPEDEYLYPGSERLDAVSELGVDFLVYGHTHVPIELRVSETLVINPGSAGEARGWKGGLLSCAMLDTDTDEVRFLEYQDPRLPVSSVSCA